MRSILAAALSLVFTAAAAAAYPIERPSDAHFERGEIQVLEYNRAAGSATFSLACPGCSDIELEADDSLAVHLQVGPSPDLTTSSVVLNGQDIDILWKDRVTESSQVVWLETGRSGGCKFEISWAGLVTVPTPSFLKQSDKAQNVHFTLTSLSGSVGFTAVMRPDSSTDRLVGLIPDSKDAQVVDFTSYADSTYSSASSMYGDDKTVTQSEQDDSFDMAGEMETLRLLEGQATRLNAEILARKKAIAYVMKQGQDELCLKHLIKECEGMICSAKAVLRRICDKAGITTQPYFGLAKQSRLQEMTALQSDNDHTGHQSEAMNVPLIVTAAGTNTADFSMQGFDIARPPNALIRALSIIAVVLGISAVIAFIKRRCMSLQKRVDRAAAREERMNARAYRRAARRALMRKRWDDFVNAINCFKAVDPKPGDYEEKRALILQDAFLEQELDHAEKGEVMEAELRELRHAHEIVSSLVRVDEHRYAVVTPIHDPPPPLVPLPYDSRDARSRANSTYTLPSYTSESLPDYTSRPPGSTTSNSVVNGYTPTTSASQGRRSPFTPLSESSRCTRYTPTSSVLEMSPRPSEETLRTRPSGDTRR